jgi:o-succinylbenzoate synthase
VTIAHVELVPFAIPLRIPLTTAFGVIELRRGVLVALSDTRGQVGLGEATPHPAAAPDALARIEDDLARATRWLTGADLSCMDDLLRAAARLTAPAAMAVDMALHDLLGVATGQPVVDLLGGARRSTVPTSALLRAGDDFACATEAHDAAAGGFTAAKIKVGHDAAAAITRVHAVHTAAPGLALRCDANGAWDADTAIAVARRLAPLDVAWIEQPVAAADLRGLRHVRRDGGLAVAADEAVTGVDSIPQLAGAADVAVLKLVQVGGLAAARATAAAARGHGMGVTVTTAFETGVARTAALHLAAALPDPLEPCGLATASLLAGDLVVDGCDDGPEITVPARPGLGVRLDPVAIARWRSR